MAKRNIMKKIIKVFCFTVLGLVISCSEHKDLDELSFEDETNDFLTSVEGVGSSEGSSGEYSYSGLSFSGWDVVVGDANYVVSGEYPITINDIGTLNTDSMSVLSANLEGRKIMTHNITYKKIVGNDLFQMRHKAAYEFKIPYDVSTQNIVNNGQTVEGGLFIWDGENTELDYGLAFQWVTNPWDPEFGNIRYWDGDSWKYLTYLEVDTIYHKVLFDLDFSTNEAYLTIDGVQYSQNIFSSTPKIGWGTTIDARFQAEVISIFPSSTSLTTAVQEIYFKNWRWEGEYY